MGVFQSPDKDKLMAELSPKSDGKLYHENSQDAKDTVKEQGNLEAHAILMITDAVQCKSCYNCGTPGHTYCKCGLVFPGVFDEVKKLVLKNIINCVEKLTTSAPEENTWSQPRLPASQGA